MLSFTVPDINSTVSKLMSLGAELDGPIKYEIHGKVLCLYVPIIPLYNHAHESLGNILRHYISLEFLFVCMQVAALRCIDGHMLGLYEPA
jgi:hypothetical protein